jgi:hypothetical protein
MRFGIKINAMNQLDMEHKQLFYATNSNFKAVKLFFNFVKNFQVSLLP